MSVKTTLTTLGSLQNETSALTDLNNNFTAINNALSDALSLSGEAPNQIVAHLDMNSHRILNLPAPVNTTEPLRLVDAALLAGGGAITAYPLPTGGTTGQFLVKLNNSNYNVGWTSSFGAAINLGTVGISGTPAINFFSSANSVQYDSRLVAVGGSATTGAGTLIMNGTFEIVPPAASLISGLTTSQAPHGTTGGVQMYNNLINITSDDADCGSNAATSYSLGLYVQHNFGGSSATGGREAIFANLILGSPTSASNGNRFYAALSGQAQANSSDGGTLGGGAKGELYGTNNISALTNGAIGFKSTSCNLSQIYMQTGSSANLKAINILCYGATDAVQGTTDAALMITADTGATAGGKYGILIGNMRGVQPLATTATILGTTGASTVANGIDLSGYTITTSAYKSTGFNVDGSGNTTVLKLNGMTLANGQFPGTATNDSATAGNIGEYVSSTVVSGSAIALTTGTPVNVTTISLTAGDWDVWINAHFTGGATTTVNYIESSVSTTSATLSNVPGNIGSIIGLASGSFFNVSADATVVPVGPVRLSLSGTTTVYLVSKASFGTSTCSTFGTIQARRVR